ncbi:MAG: aldolase catalytic domain-containing protein [Lachnospiraceae bacterium]|nr:aldolase catalytic domain-containing protein [Lachnospiraceae bacterium]
MGLSSNEIKLLDCTLRDGGYLNDWEFGKSNIINIFERLVSAGVDIIETGFIDAGRNYDENRTIFPDTEGINRTYGRLKKGDSMIVGMIDYGTCPIENVMPASECFLDGIRVIFKKHRMHEAIDFCRQVREKGYKVFAQAVSITSYDDEELSELIGLVNDLKPYAFSLVDTYGLLHKGQLRHYFDFACSHLNSDIGIGYHAHNNFQLAYANCIELLDDPPKGRMLIVDGSLYGMGKSAGNTPIELLVMHMNSYHGTAYHNSQILEAIEVTMLEMSRKYRWGYSFKFYLAASHDCHPNYVNFLMDMGKLSVKSISEILGSLDEDKRLLYDADYIRDQYFEYQKQHCADSDSVRELIEDLRGADVLLMGPGRNIYRQRDRVERYIAAKKCVTISINFIPEDYEVDYVFMSNAKRYVQLCSALNEQKEKSKLIATSNITRTLGEFDYTLNYSDLLDEEALMPDNPLIMLLGLLKKAQIKSIGLAGFDGYRETSVSNYVNPNMEYSYSSDEADNINKDTVRGIRKLDLGVTPVFVTESIYESL